MSGDLFFTFDTTRILSIFFLHSQRIIMIPLIACFVGLRLSTLWKNNLSLALVGSGPIGTASPNLRANFFCG